MTSQARAKDTRSGILSAAARLFAERGYQGTSTRAIAEAVSITQPTLWYYFRSKESILLQMFAEASEALLEGLERIQGSEARPLEKLRLALQHHVSIFAEYPDIMAVWQFEAKRLVNEHGEEMAKTRIRHTEVLMAIIEKAIAAGELKPMEPRLLALAMMALPNWVLQKLGPGGFSTQQITSFFWELLYGGFAPTTALLGDLLPGQRTG